MARLGPGPTMTIEEAVARLRAHARPSEVETVSLTDALGRFLAANVTADEPVPAHPSSAMDGYAFRYADFVPGRPMPVRGRVAAGHPLGTDLPAGHTVRIF